MTAVVFSFAATVRAQCPEWSECFPASGVLIHPIEALVAHDEDGGQVLYAGGQFGAIGYAENTANIARFDKGCWSSVGGGVDSTVRELAVFDDGTGSAVYAGGSFAMAGGVLVNSVARWDGTTWSALGSGVGGGVSALVVFDDGTGPALYVGGSFSTAGGVAASSIARWDGGSWFALGAGIVGGVSTLTVFDDGSGPALYAGGSFTMAGGVGASRVARWDGASWSPLGSGMNSTVHALEGFDDGSGPALYAGGFFNTAGGVSAKNLARWDGTSWSPMGSGADKRVRGLAVFDDGPGPALYAGGLFTAIDGVSASGVARWDGSSWSALAAGGCEGVGYAHEFAEFDDGRGNALWIGAGEFMTAGCLVSNGLSAWNGQEWWVAGNGVNHEVEALTPFDDGGGPALFAAGGFDQAGSALAKGIAKWDGFAWSQLGLGLSNPSGLGHGNALAVFDDGSGDALYVGGNFRNAGAVQNAWGVARWDGSTWSDLNGGMGGAAAPYVPWSSSTTGPVRRSSPEATSCPWAESPRSEWPAGMASRGPRSEVE